jgi:hypothetical protein
MVQPLHRSRQCPARTSLTSLSKETISTAKLPRSKRLGTNLPAKPRMTLQLVALPLAPHSALWQVLQLDQRRDMWGQARQLALVLV